MKKLVTSLLVLGAMTVLVSGCSTKEETKGEVDLGVAAAAAELPKAEQPKGAKPKDHPAH
jgi:uncharacterized lipoprotein